MEKTTVHLAIWPSIMRIVQGETKKSDIKLMCFTNEDNPHGTFNINRVNCRQCKERMNEYRWDLLRCFIRTDERVVVARVLASGGFITGVVEKFSDTMLILRSATPNDQLVYLRRVTGIIDGEMTSSRGLTVKNGDLWVERFHFGEILSSHLVRNHKYWIHPHWACPTYRPLDTSSLGTSCVPSTRYIL